MNDRPADLAILWSHCGFAKLDAHTGQLTEIACPAPGCSNWAPLIGMRIAAHDRLTGGECLWRGIRVIDDRVHDKP